MRRYPESWRRQQMRNNLKEELKKLEGQRRHLDFDIFALLVGQLGEYVMQCGFIFCFWFLSPGAELRSEALACLINERDFCDRRGFEISDELERYSIT